MLSRKSYALNIQILINTFKIDLRKCFLGIKIMPSFGLYPEWKDCCQTALAFPILSRWVLLCYQIRNHILKIIFPYLIYCEPQLKFYYSLFHFQKARTPITFISFISLTPNRVDILNILWKIVYPRS